MTTFQFEEDRARLARILHRLRIGLPDGQWVLNGSAVLVLHGIETGRPMGDLDIFCATRVWFSLVQARPWAWTIRTPDPEDFRERCDPPYLEREMYNLPVHVFHSWRTRHIADIDINWLVLNAEEVGGWPCAPLQAIVDWKDQKLRAKDAIDLEAIRRHRPDLFPEVQA